VKTAYKKSFLKDIRTVNDPVIKNRLRETIEQAEQAQRLTELSHLKKLRGTQGYYRIRLGDYRVGLLLENDVLVFVRFLHRRDVYRYFP
jgi:mRNA interferase RelE/StbE